MTAAPIPPHLPEQVLQAAESLIGSERPKWSRKALAKLLHFVFPNVQASRWERCLFGSSNLNTLLEPLAETPGWFFGRIHRVLGEARAAGLWESSPLAAISWLEVGDFATGALKGGHGITGAMADYLDEVLRWPVNDQLAFWKSFAAAYSLPFPPRHVDSKTFAAYTFLVFQWQEISKCSTIPEAYQKFREFSPLEAPTQGTDPVDFQLSQYKWFEKLCQRNLGITLAPRGRPARKIKSPQR